MCNLITYAKIVFVSAALQKAFLKGTITIRSKLLGTCMLYVTEVSLAISLNGASGTNTELSYEHTLTMQSPPTSFDVESCLELMYTAQSQFYVKLVCVNYNGTYNEQLLHSSRQPLGLTPHKLKLALPATVSDQRQCALAFEVKTATTGVAAVISNIAVFPGQCPPAS